MCDYSLSAIASRPAKVGDKLVTTRFFDCITRGFSALAEPNVAVCLLPGTEVGFEKEVEYDHFYGDFRNRKVGAAVAQFRQVDQERPNVHHDALEFPNGKILLMSELSEGQRATVLQLPADGRSVSTAVEGAKGIVVRRPIFSHRIAKLAT